MAKLRDINWDLLKFQYEVLGVPLEEIQSENDISDALLQYNSRDWNQAPLISRKNLQFTNLDSLTELTDEVIGQVQEESQITNTIKQKFLLPKYIELESILLEKSISLAKGLEAERASASALNTLTSVLTSLLKHNPILAPANQDEESKGNQDREWKITFVGADAESPDTEETSAVSDD